MSLDVPIIAAHHEFLNIYQAGIPSLLKMHRKFKSSYYVE